jgi:hypothetical protein
VVEFRRMKIPELRGPLLTAISTNHTSKLP